MRKFFIIVCLLISVYLPAQNGDSLDWDIDTIFDEPPPASPSEDAKAKTAVPAVNTPTVKKVIKQRGYTFGVSYGFSTGLAPGWQLLPWNSGWHGEDYYLDRGINLNGGFNIDAQISDVFRVISTFSFQIPGFSFNLGDLFFDYNFNDTVFFRGGKYNHSWGISPNYGFTNLLSRVPKEGFSGDSYIYKVDVPIGVGGIQALALTRVNLNGGVIPKIEDFGLGGKYNLALRLADLDMGVYYKDNMPLRGFLSIKTTIGKTEVYNEWLGVIDLQNSSELSGAVNLGFARDFLDKKFSLAGELFFNTEGNAYWYRPGTTIQKSDISPFIEGLNIAINTTYRPWEKGNPRLFLQFRYAPSQDSAYLVPGFRLTPWSNIDFSIAAPMALGSKDGYYYTHSATDDKGRHLPFSLVFLISMSGSVQSGHY